MGCSTGTLQALARAPGLLVSTVLTCMVGALLPPLAGLALFVGRPGLDGRAVRGRPGAAGGSAGWSGKGIE